MKTEHIYTSELKKKLLVILGLFTNLPQLILVCFFLNILNTNTYYYQGNKHKNSINSLDRYVKFKDIYNFKIKKLGFNERLNFNKVTISFFLKSIFIFINLFIFLKRRHLLLKYSNNVTFYKIYNLLISITVCVLVLNLINSINYTINLNKFLKTLNKKYDFNKIDSKKNKKINKFLNQIKFLYIMSIISSIGLSSVILVDFILIFNLL